MFEISGVAEDVAREAMRLAMHKLLSRKFIVKETEGGENNEASEIRIYQ